MLPPKQNLKRTCVIVFLTALAVRLAYLLFIYADANTLITDDSRTYLELAETMLKTHGFNRDVGGVISPETERVPVYIIFLAIHRFLFGNAALAGVISQLILDSFACVIIAMIASKINGQATLLAGLVTALNPTQIIYGSLILTDSLFHFFVCLFILFLARSLKEGGLRNTILLGLSLGLAIMTRDLMLYWPIVFIPLLFIHDLKKSKNGVLSFARSALLFFTIILCLSPLLIRNAVKFDSFSLTSHTGTHALQWVLPLIWEVSRGTPWAKGSAEAEKIFLDDPENRVLVEEANPFKISGAKTRVFREEFRKVSPLKLVQTWGTGMVMTLFAPSIIQIPPIKNLPRTGFFKTEAASKWEKIKGFIFNNSNKTFGLALFLGLLGVLTARIVQIMGTAHWFKSRQENFLFLICLLWVGYILAINGPIATAKYRLPIEPVLSITAAMGLAALTRRWPGKGGNK